jgi:hypothetical protein
MFCSFLLFCEVAEYGLRQAHPFPVIHFKSNPCRDVPAHTPARVSRGHHKQWVTNALQCFHCASCIALHWSREPGAIEYWSGEIPLMWLVHAFAYAISLVVCAADPRGAESMLCPRAPQESYNQRVRRRASPTRNNVGIGALQQSQRIPERVGDQQLRSVRICHRFQSKSFTSKDQ